MKELDIVKLTSSYKNIAEGTEGTIVIDYDDDTCEVEFFDSNGDTIKVIAVPKKLLELVWVFSDNELL
ncbi:MAG: DUF4926 domain-containing protein [Clostridia bacterium]|nr:DUF4926 domain-containing protein [Clostridia bacterium]